MTIIWYNHVRWIDFLFSWNPWAQRLLVSWCICWMALRHIVNHLIAPVCNLVSLIGTCCIIVSIMASSSSSRFHFTPDVAPAPHIATDIQVISMFLSFFHSFVHSFIRVDIIEHEWIRCSPTIRLSDLITNVFENAWEHYGNRVKYHQLRFHTWRQRQITSKHIAVATTSAGCSEEVQLVTTASPTRSRQIR